MKNFLIRVATDREHGIAGVLARPFLTFLSWIYGLASGLVRCYYSFGPGRPYKAGVPVISIGNITAGGVGKTPLVMLVARLLSARGLHPVVLTRGYMTSAARSDEALMMRQRLKVPVLVGADRAALARKAAGEMPADAFILDDGFQHWRLKRELDIVVIDAVNPFGNGAVLPRGILREPLTALRRADIFVVSKADLGAANLDHIRKVLARVAPARLVVETVHAPVAAVNVLTGERSSGLGVLAGRAVAMCAIGAPEAFLAMLQREGTLVEKMFVWADHHDYTEADVREVAAFCRQHDISKIITTHKDAVKLDAFHEAFQGVSLFMMEIEIRVVHGEAEFISRIGRLFHP